MGRRQSRTPGSVLGKSADYVVHDEFSRHNFTAVIEQARRDEARHIVELAIQTVHATSQHVQNQLRTHRRSAMGELVKMVQDDVSEYITRWYFLAPAQHELFSTLIVGWKSDVEDCFLAVSLLCEGEADGHR